MAEVTEMVMTMRVNSEGSKNGKKEIDGEAGMTYDISCQRSSLFKFIFLSAGHMIDTNSQGLMIDLVIHGPRNVLVEDHGLVIEVVDRS